ncbi:MAG: hypothetical protein V7K81_29885, partial [Nostoc sp.]
WRFLTQIKFYLLPGSEILEDVLAFFIPTYCIHCLYLLLHRVKRGMYRTCQGFLINADFNGAANIFRKVETQLGLNLVKVCRQVLTLATRFPIWETKTKKRREAALALPVATV